MLLTMLMIIIEVLLFFTVLAVSALFCMRCHIKTSCRWNGSHVSLVGKTAIVTGANTGIGFFTALDFAKRGAHVILACRNEERALAAKASIIQQTGNRHIECRLVDYASLRSIRKFAESIRQSVEKIDILVNNAGSAGASNYETEDGLILTWQINHFAPFLLTTLLLDKIKSTPDSRIVIVASVAAKFSNLTIDDLNRYPKRKFKVLAKNALYMWTKHANILFGLELARRLSNTGTNVYVLHPGSVASNIWRRIPAKILSWYKLFMKFIYRTSEEGAQTSIYCAVAKECAQQNGDFYVDCRPVGVYPNCKDVHFQRALWQRSEEFVRLTD